MTWDDTAISMKQHPVNKKDQEPTALQELIWDHLEEELEDGLASDIMSSAYASHDVRQVAQSQTHLTLEQQSDLEAILREFPALFDGKLKKYKGPPIHPPLHVASGAGLYPLRQNHSLIKNHHGEHGPIPITRLITNLQTPSTFPR